MIVEHVKNDSTSLRVYLEKASLKQKVEQEKRARIKFKNISTKGESGAYKKGLTSNIQVEIIDQIYNQRFQKYLDG